MKKMTFSPIFYCLVMLCPYVQAQRVVKVLQPEVYSSFKGGITLPNGDSRVFVSTREENISDFRPVRFIDCNGEGGIIEPEILQDSSGAILFDSTRELFVMPLKNGDCILGSNDTYCDDVEYSAQIAYLEANGVIRWNKDIRVQYHYTGLKSLALADTNVVACVFGIYDTLYYNFSGNERHYDTPPKLYTNPYFFNGFIYGGRNGKLVKLDSNFQESETYPTPGLTFFGHLRGDTFLLCSANGLELLNSALSGFYSRPDIKSVKSAFSKDTILYLVYDWAIDVLDMHLNDLRRFDTLPYEIMRFAFPWKDSVLVVSDYGGGSHDDIVFRSYKSDGIHDIGITDLAIEKIEIPDTVRLHLMNTSPFNTYYFDTISFTIRNLGNTTVNSFSIRYNDHRWCYGVNDDILVNAKLEPEQSFVYSIVDYIIDSTFEDHGLQYCFWVELPNNHPDNDPSNDTGCSFSKLVGIQDIRRLQEIKVFPNPMEHDFTIDFEDGLVSDAHLSLNSVQGLEVYTQKIFSSKETIHVTNLSPGVYYVQVFNRGRLICTKSIVILP